MLVDVAMFRTIYRELTAREGFERTPERDLVMSEPPVLRLDGLRSAS